MFQPYKKKCSSWSSHFLQCESQSFAWHKSWRKPGFISSAACKTACSYSSFPSRITDYFFSILIFFLETCALNDFFFGPSYPLLLFSWPFCRGLQLRFYLCVNGKGKPPSLWEWTVLIFTTVVYSPLIIFNVMLSCSVNKLLITC